MITFDIDGYRRRQREYYEQMKAGAAEAREYAVEADNLYSFLCDYHKFGFVEVDDKEWWEKLHSFGYVTIPAEYSTTGKTVSFFGRAI